jgi:hypothetical protein
MHINLHNIVLSVDAKRVDLYLFGNSVQQRSYPPDMSDTLVQKTHLTFSISQDMDLTCSGQLSYLGNSWRKDVSFAGYGVPLQVSTAKMQDL